MSTNISVPRYATFTASQINSPEPSDSHIIIPKYLKSKGEVTVPDACFSNLSFLFDDAF